ncbi:MAG: hypothetical protein LWX56_06330 [Ignavibacteria bacterium]|nr:hypothetical protein [Ignavibacteria bacterium]
MVQFTVQKNDLLVPISLEKSLTIQNIGECKALLERISDFAPEILEISADGDLEIDFSFVQLFVSFWRFALLQGWKIKIHSSFAAPLYVIINKSGFTDFKNQLDKMAISLAEEKHE